jgi:hypothetical protein
MKPLSSSRNTSESQTLRKPQPGLIDLGPCLVVTPSMDRLCTYEVQRILAGIVDLLL